MLNEKKSGRARGYIEDYRPHKKTRALIAAVETILAQYVPTYGPMTLRQIFYRLVASAAYPKTENAYEGLGSHLNNARRARLIPFSDMRDDTLTVDLPSGHEGLGDFVASLDWQVRGYQLQRAAGQPVRTIVAVESNGMVPMAASILEPYGVIVRSAGGFCRTDGNKALADDIRDLFDETGRPTRLLQAGDYDPSGEHIYSAFAEDVAAFIQGDGGDPACFVHGRVALTPAQIVRFKLPSALRKAGDNRTFSGMPGNPDATCQLEALTPPDLAGILVAAVEEMWDPEIAAATLQREADERAGLLEWLKKARKEVLR